MENSTNAGKVYAIHVKICPNIDWDAPDLIYAIAHEGNGSYNAFLNPLPSHTGYSTSTRSSEQIFLIILCKIMHFVLCSGCNFTTVPAATVLPLALGVRPVQVSQF